MTEMEIIRQIKEEAGKTIRLYTLNSESPLYQVAIMSLLKIEAICNQYEEQIKCQQTSLSAQTE